MGDAAKSLSANKFAPLSVRGSEQFKVNPSVPILQRRDFGDSLSADFGLVNFTASLYVSKSRLQQVPRCSQSGSWEAGCLRPAPQQFQRRLLSHAGQASDKFVHLRPKC